MSNYTTPPWLDTGDNAWQLTAASLVGLQSVPGLVVLYAGIVKRKWAINSAFMAFYAYAAVMICWVLWAYKMGFGKQLTPFVGVPGPLTDYLKRARSSHFTSVGYYCELSNVHDGVFSVRVCGYHGGHHRWFLYRSHEFHRMDGFRTIMAHLFVYDRSVQSLGRWFSTSNGRH